MTNQSWRRYAAELLGTFTLVFIGCTTVVGATRADAPVLLVAAFGFGLALLAGLYAFGEVSGGHFNPAVSLAMFIDRRMSARDLGAYWIAQIAGGILGAVVLLIATSKADVASAATTPSSDGTAFVIELALTAIFVAVILQASTSEGFGSSALVAIPLTLVAVHLAAIAFSGCGVNPARTLGPDLVGNSWTGVWIYLVAPLLGAAIAAFIHRTIVAPFHSAVGAPVAEVLEEQGRSPA